MTSFQLHCCPLLLNLNGFDLALQIVLVCFLLSGQRSRTFVRCRACSVHKQLHGKKGSQTEDGGGGSSAAGGGGGGRSTETGAGGREGESEGSSPAAGVDGGDDSGSTEVVEAEARQQVQVVAEAKTKAAALQQAWMEVATAEAHQQAWAEAAAVAARQQADEAAAVSRQQAEADAAVAAATPEQQRIAQHTRARATNG